MSDPRATAMDPQCEMCLPDMADEIRDGVASHHLAGDSNAHYLNLYLGDLDTTVMSGWCYVSPVVTGDATGLFAPDLFVSFNANDEGITERNGYVISEQGKPPDFVLEVASYASGNLDATVKRDAYAALGIPEYWRFDPTGEYNGDYLAGDRLEDVRYQPIAIERVSADLWQGYSQALDVHLQWHRFNPHPYRKGKLDFYDARMDRRLSTMTTELASYYRERARLLVPRPGSGNWRNAWVNRTLETMRGKRTVMLQ